MNLEIYRAAVLKATVAIDESTTYNGEFMGMDKIDAQFTVSAPIDIQLDDYVVYNGKNYSIKTAIGLEQVDSKTFIYEVTFFSPTYDMYDVLIMHLGRTKFSYTGTPLEVLSLIVDCLNAEQTGWTIEDCSTISEPQTFTFDQQSCRTALSNLADTFKLEYRIEDKAITLLESIGDIQPIVLQYGRGHGLTNANRQAVDNAFATVWFGFGGSENLPEAYRSGMDRLALDAPIEVNVDKYGRKQGSVTFEDCYPRRTSTITAINGLYEVTDSTLDFDINAQQITDGGAKIVFKSGELSGQEFVITSYNNTTKTIRLGINKDEQGYNLPNATFSAQIGDKYTLIGIVMPTVYITAAETELAGLLADYAAKNSFPPVAFPLNLDEKYIRDNSLQGLFIPGDKVHVTSVSLGVDTDLRLQSVSWPLVNNALISGVVSDVVQYTLTEKVIKDIGQTKKDIKAATTSNILESRQATANLMILKDLVFDPSGNYYTEKIKPASVETLYLSVGAKQNDFNLADVIIKANYNGDKSKINISNGYLLHNSIQIDGLGFNWAMVGVNITGLVDATQYYVYAKCSRLALAGTFVVSDVQISLEHLADYYHFNMGVLFAVNATGYRDFEFTKGMAYLVGDTLTAGKIKSLDAQTYFDLTNNKFKMGDATNSLDWNVTTAGKLTIKGSIVATDADFINLVVKNLATAAVSNKRVVINGTDNNIRVLDASNNVLIEIDDDSALERIRKIINDYPLPPTYEPVYGPGYRVGSATSGNSSSLSRVGLVTSIDGVIQHKIGKEPLTGKGYAELDVEGGMILKKFNLGGTLTNVKIVLAGETIDGVYIQYLAWEAL